MRKHLVTYLTDHAAAVVATIELAKRTYNSNKGSDLGAFLADLIPKLEEEQAALKSLLKSLNASDSMVKNLAAWSAEKVGRLKLNDSLLSYSALSRVVELEGLIAATEIKTAMWEALAAHLAGDPAFSQVNCARFAAENKATTEKLTMYHQDAARVAFAE